MFMLVFVVIMFLMVFVFVMVMILILRFVISSDGHNKSGRIVTDEIKKLSIEIDRKSCRVILILFRFNLFLVIVVIAVVVVVERKLVELKKRGKTEISSSVDAGEVGQRSVERRVHAEINQSLKRR